MADNESGTGDISQSDLLSENQNLRAQKDEIWKQIGLKIDAQTEKLTEHGQKFNEISEKLQSMEKLISKISKVDEDVEPKENSNQDVKTPEKLPNTIDSNVSKNSVPVSEKRFVLKHVFKNVENFVEEGCNDSVSENHFNVDSFIRLKRADNHLAFYVFIHGPKKATKWAVQTKINVKIDGPKQKSKVAHFDLCYETDAGYGFPEFLKWDEMKNEYLIDGSLTVEAHVQKQIF
ncbi:hypothetical protein B9Z55_007078 [Caenorhabditis nigoni]|uniref:MATH domain-containing protein n=1 Tax=Caenorhabditis nigoni TaxID=1611254 RepID=A0A2G5V7Y7_9PELO|nr:hypothetical protein B9Z55_007078 [Caenorhabditis nigoni]